MDEQLQVMEVRGVMDTMILYAVNINRWSIAGLIMPAPVLSDGFGLVWFVLILFYFLLILFYFV